jgi:hypothetical protein
MITEKKWQSGYFKDNSDEVRDLRLTGQISGISPDFPYKYLPETG